MTYCSIHLHPDKGIIFQSRIGFVPGAGLMYQDASAFMIDLAQVSLALRGVTERSLVILDEFGKGQLTSSVLLKADVQGLLQRTELACWLASLKR